MSEWVFTLNEADLLEKSYFLNIGDQGHGPYEFKQLSDYRDNSNTKISELALFQSLHKALYIDSSGSFANLYPNSCGNFQTAINNPKVDISSRIKIDKTVDPKILEITKATFFSSQYLYSKEVVLMVAISEAALRSQYPKMIQNKLTSMVFDKKDRSFKALYHKATDINFLKQNYLRFKDINLKDVQNLKFIADTYSIAIKFYYFDSDNTLKSIFQVPENPEITPIPIIKLIELNDAYRILYTKEENDNDGFDDRGNCVGMYSNEEISDSFYTTIFPGFKEVYFYDILDILALLGKSDPKSKNTARINFERVYNSIKERYISYSNQSTSKCINQTYENLMQKLEDADKIFLSSKVSKSEPVNMMPSNNIQGSENKSKPPLQHPPLNSNLYQNPLSKQMPPSGATSKPNSNQNSSFGHRPPSGGTSNPISNQNAMIQLRPPSEITPIPNSNQNGYLPISKPDPNQNSFSSPRYEAPINFVGPNTNNPYPPQATSNNLNSFNSFGQPERNSGREIASNYQNKEVSSKIFDTNITSGVTRTITANRQKQCPSCDRNKILLNFHDRCTMCKSCIASSIIDKRCFNCSSTSNEFITCARRLRDEGFKCSSCGANKKDVLVNEECMCIVCRDCESKLKLHNYHTYQ